eukprot:g1906.t1
MNYNTVQILLFLLPTLINGHGYLSCPKPRQYRGLGQDLIVNGTKIGWTKWVGITVPGDKSFNPGLGNVPNLNAAIGGGTANEDVGSSATGHGVCGDIGSRKGFTAGGTYGATPARGVYKQGGVIDVQVRITAPHAGHFEFRLCEERGPGLSTPATQECLNKHVLEIDSSTPDYPAVVDGYQQNVGLNAKLSGEYKCKVSGGDAATHTDPTATSNQSKWPYGSCCNGGGTCSPPASNKDRYVSNYATPTIVEGHSVYKINLKIPAGVTCERCVLQWTWQTGNSAGTFPESFWNCADIAIKPANYTGTTGCGVNDTNDGGNSVAANPTPTPNPSPNNSNPTPTPTANSTSSFCSTTWAEYGGGKKANCIPCVQDNDCPAGRSCWSETYCTERQLCGKTGDDDCGASPSPSPTPNSNSSSSTKEIDWLSLFTSPSARSVTVAPGTTLNFSWTGSHNVLKLPSASALDDCDFTTWENVGGENLTNPETPTTSGVSYVVSANAANGTKLYFACGVGGKTGHCAVGQALTVTVQESGQTTIVTVKGPESDFTCPSTEANRKCNTFKAKCTAWCNGLVAQTECAKTDGAFPEGYALNVCQCKDGTTLKATASCVYPTSDTVISVVCTNAQYCNGRGIAVAPTDANTHNACFCECERGFSGLRCESNSDVNQNVNGGGRRAEFHFGLYFATIPFVLSFFV